MRRMRCKFTCIGFIPSPREGHSAAMVDDVVYVFGGRGVDGKDLGDLGAFKVTSTSVLFWVCVLWFDVDPCRPAMVYVPENGPGSITTVRSRHGIYGFSSLCPRWSWRGVS